MPIAQETFIRPVVSSDRLKIERIDSTQQSRNRHVTTLRHSLHHFVSALFIYPIKSSLLQSL